MDKNDKFYKKFNISCHRAATSSSSSFVIQSVKISAPDDSGPGF